jgi:hypothetical protein
MKDVAGTKINETLVNIQSTWYIDVIRFLQYLEERVRLLERRIAVPGTDHPTTEALRGRHSELTTLIQQLTEHTNDRRTN